ncbi:hypothetical protein B0T10DRAFT_157241 [Thelonectria olida]|uniref:Uncharacterized protein n=1 Tax=Thelonectria olida TaxID=1576542 RepID=A0A9P9AKV2_9HYPO|nr:hypothetical protein B0T10DRAFT_157241 [Thelonectria olida]
MPRPFGKNFPKHLDGLIKNTQKVLETSNPVGTYPSGRWSIERGIIRISVASGQSSFKGFEYEAMWNAAKALKIQDRYIQRILEYLSSGLSIILEGRTARDRSRQRAKNRTLLLHGILSHGLFEFLVIFELYAIHNEQFAGFDEASDEARWVAASRVVQACTQHVLRKLAQMPEDDEVIWPPGLFWTICSGKTEYETVCEKLGLGRFAGETCTSPFIRIGQIKAMCEERKSEYNYFALPMTSPFRDGEFTILDTPNDILELASLAGNLHLEAKDQYSKAENHQTGYVSQLKRLGQGTECQCFQIGWSKDLHQPVFSRVKELLVDKGLLWRRETIKFHCYALHHAYGTTSPRKGFLQIIIPVLATEGRVFLLAEGREETPIVWGMDFIYVLGQNTSLRTETGIDYIDIAVPISSANYQFGYPSKSGLIRFPLRR